MAGNDKYTESVGRRKTSVARVRLKFAPKSAILINDKVLNEYFVTQELRNVVEEPFLRNKSPKKYSISVKVSGGGIHSQAEAIRHGITRALTMNETELRKPLKNAGLLTRDSRIKERRKFGLKKARRAPQWSKR